MQVAASEDRELGSGALPRLAGKMVGDSRAFVFMPVSYFLEQEDGSSRDSLPLSPEVLATSVFLGEWAQLWTYPLTPPPSSVCSEALLNEEFALGSLAALVLCSYSQAGALSGPGLRNCLLRIAPGAQAPPAVLWTVHHDCVPGARVVCKGLRSDQY